MASQPSGTHLVALPQLLTSIANRSLTRLVATLGSKSTLKNVPRKAILEVDVVKTCDTIIEPAAPMALRLSSNLLCVMVLTRLCFDATADRNVGTVSRVFTRSSAATS